jgi:hypothetical protein
VEKYHEGLGVFFNYTRFEMGDGSKIKFRHM